MGLREDGLAQGALERFVSASIPTYIQEMAGDLIASSGISKRKTKSDGVTWEASGIIQGDDFQNYMPSLTVKLDERLVQHSCNCENGFGGVCVHVAALAMHFAKELRRDFSYAAVEEEVKPRIDWRQSFRTFFETSTEPEPGRHYLVFRFFPEPGRLTVAFYRARQNKTGLSTVLQETTLEQILQNQDWCVHPHHVPDVVGQIGHFLDYYGQRVEIPDGLVSWFFWAVRREYYLYWKDTLNPCSIVRTNMSLKIRPRLEEDGLHFDVYLQQEGKMPFCITDDESEVSFHGLMPMWVCWNQSFYPIQTSLLPSLVKELVTNRPVIPQDNLSEFLDRVWANIPSSELYEPEDFLRMMEPVFQPASYDPKIFLGEEGSLLTLEVQNVYSTIHGEFVLNGPNPDFQTGSYTYEGKTYLVRRDQAQEADLMNQLAEMRFQPRNNRIWFMEPEEAIAFLLDSYPKLVENWRVFGEQALHRYKVRIAKPSIIAKVESNEKEKWFSLDIGVDYEGQTLPLDKIWRAWAKGRRYIQLKDGSYTSLPESWLEKLAHKLQVLGFDPTRPPKRQFKQFEATVLDNILEDLPDARTDGFWDKLHEKVHTFKEVEPIGQPAGVDATLRQYQLQGVSYLNFLSEYGFGGILADEMGLGKTLQTLSFLQYMVNTGNDGPNLIVVPTSVLPNWEREAQRFVPGLRLLIIYGARREGMFKRIGESHIVLTTYALLRRDLEELQKVFFNSIILDEAQNIKNPTTITARSVRTIKARMRLCLSGTPIENNLFELWSLFEFLMPGFLGSQHAFQRGVVKPIRDGDAETLEYLRSRVKPFILRRTKAEVAKDLPPKIETVSYCDMLDEQMELYMALSRKLREQVFADVEERGIAKSQMSILDALLKLRQICCHPRLLKLDLPDFNTGGMPSGKFEAFKEMVCDVVEGGHKVLVFSQFVQMLQIIRGWLMQSGISFCYLDGTSKDRLQQVDRFNGNADIPVFLISLKAGGTGLNLTSADYVIHYDPWWNPAVESQATDRTHRIGQTRQVFSYKMICQNSVEEKILKLQDMKRGVAEAIIPGQDSWKSLTREDLEMLFEV